jgi:hypothetical protein
MGAPIGRQFEHILRDLADVASELITKRYFLEDRAITNLRSRNNSIAEALTVRRFANSFHDFSFSSTAPIIIISVSLDLL